LLLRMFHAEAHHMYFQ